MAAVYTEITAAFSQKSGTLATFARRNPTVMVGGTLLMLVSLIAIFAPVLSGDPMSIAPAERLTAPSAEHWFGTDALGRDVYARTLYGARISLVVGVCATALSVAVGLAIGLITGYYRRADGYIMRVMDGMMAIPSILLAIGMIAVTQGGMAIVVLAITVPEIPRVARLVRSVVLSTRELAFVEAAVVSGSRDLKIIHRHILPSTIAPLIVQGTLILASAILAESSLSFLGIGVPPEIPTWGNMISAHRLYLVRAPWSVFFPGAFLTVVVLAVNLLGDGLRDRLDPRLARRI
ncbi:MULTISPECIES: ABC transporter permease [unclassified Bradyrhizobium]|uniref:ABC transporter permease n=1 Tax=unclassified Bradyrhizobium TaxID=2631580 RepID=UPI001FFA9D77|nr:MULTISPECIES: ABC transporter permease [unclassified Bradyrhizobium]MCK1536037.1 ABC transporter permease [Bradyrhizobium sp. 176]MCK1561642.1 ABC transporter permease [Bradyrhizobium sp. 171]